MIKIFIQANHQEPAAIHLFRENELGGFAHRVTEMCPCKPLSEPLNVGDGFIYVHQNGDRLAETQSQPEHATVADNRKSLATELVRDLEEANP